MRNLETVFKEADQILMPNRYQEPFAEAFQSITGIEVPRVEGRKLSACSAGKVFRFMRGRDIPSVVDELGAVSTIGLTGSEWFVEYRCSQRQAGIECRVVSEKSMGRIALLTPAGNETAANARLQTGYRPMQVATSYPNLVMSLALSGRFNMVPKMSVAGCVEAAAGALNLPAVDLVSSGETAAINGFAEAVKLMDVYPVAVGVRGVFDEAI